MYLPGGNILGIYSCVELDCSKRCDTSHMEGHRVGRPTLMCPADPMAGRARAKPRDIFGMTVRGSGILWAARVTHGTYLWYSSANMLFSGDSVARRPLPSFPFGLYHGAMAVRAWSSGNHLSSRGVRRTLLARGTRGAMLI